tara:strand:+ start:201 stop:569 length:369 start_codon:yes stop_codon:yes gene_type:complete
MIYFTRGSTEIGIKDPTWPEGPEVIPRQVVGLSGGGAVKVAVVGNPDTIARLVFRKIPSAQYAALLAFIQSTITFSAYTFQYKDWNNVTLNNMRYMGGIETWKRRRGNFYEGTLALREDLGV